MKKIILGLCLLILTSMVFAITKEEVLGIVPNSNVLSQTQLKENFFIVNGASTGNYVEEAKLYQKYAGNIAYSACIENFSDTSFFVNMRNEKIPTFTQSYGASFLNYLKEKDALDYTWGDLNINKKVINPDSHLLSMSNPATIDLWRDYIRGSVYNGANGYIFTDQMSPVGFGRGSGGCNPVTIAQFRMDLEGRDEGFVCNINKENKTIKFPDYMKFYLGFVPQPVSLGLKSWDEYYPTRKAVYDPEGYNSYVVDGEQPIEFYYNVDNETKKDYIPEFLIRDMLIHYEYIKFCDVLGKQAGAIGGAYYPMALSEDMANGVDTYFISSLSSLKGNMQKNLVSNNNVSYTRIGYLTSNIENISNKRFGVVLDKEYENYVNYILAYESKLVNNANIIEAKSLSCANGFKYADQDKGEKLKPDFTTVVSRRIFRPWGKEYKDYLTTFGDPNKEIQPEELLYNNGYVFKTVGFENAENLAGEMVVWTPNTPTVDKFDAFLKRMKDEHIVTGLMVAEGLDTVLNNNLKVVNLADYFPEYTRELVKPTDDNVIKVICRGSEYNIDGNYYKMPQLKVALASDEKTPLLYSTKIGKSDMYVLPFNPALKENAKIAKYVYDIVLDRSSIASHWEGLNGATAGIYKTKKGYTVRISNQDVSKYITDVPCEVKIVLEPNKDYFVYNLFDGEEEKITSDDHGNISLKSNDKSIALFFVRDKQDADLVNQINERRAEYLELLNIK